MHTNMQEFRLEELVEQQATVLPARNMMQTSQTVGVAVVVAVTVTGLPEAPPLPPSPV